MSRSAPIPQQPSRPRFADYFLILCGMAASLLLVNWSGLTATPRGEGAAVGRTALELIRYLLFLPQGIVLLWPLFYTTQRLAGRTQGLSAAEWVWGFAWLGAIMLAGWVGWRHFAPANADELKSRVLLGYVVLVVTMAVIALLIGLIDLVGRWPQPWTHAFCLALMIWPAFPLAGLWIWNIELK